MVEMMPAHSRNAHDAAICVCVIVRFHLTSHRVVVTSTKLPVDGQVSLIRKH